MFCTGAIGKENHQAETMTFYWTVAMKILMACNSLNENIGYRGNYEFEWSTMNAAYKFKACEGKTTFLLFSEFDTDAKSVDLTKKIFN